MALWDLDKRMERTLARVQAATGVSVAFGGPVSAAGAVRLDLFAGPTVGALPGVTLDPSQGLGGKAVQLRRVLAVNDYFDAPNITHRYDAIIRAEGLRSLVAAPVIVGRRPVGIIYGAFRGTEVIGGRIQDTVMHEARCLEQELVAEAVADGRAVSDTTAENARLHERARATYGELRRLARYIDDPDLRAALHRAAQRLVDPPDTTARNRSPAVALTGREIDVLALAGSGMTNGQIAEVLGLRIHTVKGYMKAAMAKLGANSRLDAVHRARRAGVVA